MFKLIIVDDEEVAREGLSQFIDWKQLGLELVSSFPDGKEAIEYLKNNKVDVVLTDVDMSDVSGLELAQYIYENLPTVKTVIISGHRNFEYAQTAIKYNVKHYLTKPTDMNEIKNVFTKLKNELQEANRIQDEKQEERERFEKLIPLLKEQFLLYILTGSLKDKEELKSRLLAIDLPVDPEFSYCCIINVEINKLNEGNREKIKKTLQRLFQDNKNGIYYFSFYYSHNILKVLAVSSQSDKTLLKESIDSFLKKIKQSMYNNFKINLSFERESIYNNLIELSESMRLRKTPHDIGLKIDNKTKIDLKEYRKLMYKYKRFIPFLINGEQEKIEENLNIIFEEIKQFPITDIQRLIIDLFVMITQSFVDYGLDIFSKKKDRFLYHDILEMDNIDEIRGWSMQWLDEFMQSHILESPDSPTKQIIEKAMLYIQSNYHEDISLENVADHVYLNSVYFSRLFKDYTGRNFSDYLRSIRIKKAIELLEKNKYKVYEISEKVGYKSSKYFSRVFRQYTGYAPQEYSQRVLTLGNTIKK